MRLNRWAMILDGVLALAAWAVLLVVMNSVPPSALTQALFLVLFALAVGLAVVPLALVLADRWAASLGRRGNLQRAVRQGTIAGVLAAMVMGLRFLRVLNVWVVLALVMAAVVVEALLRLRYP